MKISMTKYLLIILILFTLIPPLPLHAETVPCQQTLFKVKTPHKEDLNITGQALNDKTVTVKVDQKLYEDLVTANGQFDIKLDVPLTGNEKIEVVQGLNKINIDLTDPNLLEDSVLQSPFNCEGLSAEISTETPTTEEAATDTATTEEAATEIPTTEEAATEIPTTEEAATEIATTEEATTETATTEEATTETATTEEAATETPTTEEATTETATTEEATTETVTTEEATTETPTTEEATTEAPVILKKRTLMRNTFSLAPTTTLAAASFSSCPTITDYNAMRSAAVTKAVIGKIACVSTAAEFDTAVKDTTVEVVLMMANITTSSSNNIVSTSGQKVIDANNYILHMTSSDGLAVQSTSTVKEVIVQNAANLLNTVSASDKGFVNVYAPFVNIRYSNVTYNSGSVTAGHLGIGSNSTMYFYGTNIVNINGPQFMAKYGQVRVQDGGSLTISSNLNGFLFENTNSLNEVGLYIGQNAKVSINGTNGDVLHFNSNVPYNISAGANSSLTLTGNKAVFVNLIHTASSASNILFDTGSTINFKSHYNALKLGNEMVAINIKSGANVRLSANQDVFYTDPSSINFPFNIEKDAKVVIEKTSTVSGAALNISNPFTYNIDQAASVDFINPNGVIFTRSDTQRFNITNVAVRKWQTAVTKSAPDKQTPIIASGSFTMQNSTTALSGMPTNFATDFDPSMYRLQFIPAPLVPNPQQVYDDYTKITGTAQPGVTITMTNSRTKSTQTTTADSSGNFVFTLASGSLIKDDVLSFAATSEGYTSPTVTRTVIGTILELVTPADIVFKTTTIQSNPGLIINRETPVDYIVKVKDTKTNGTWSVTAQATKPMTSPKGEVLNDALIYKQGSAISSLKSAVKVTDKSKAVSTTAGEYDTKWSSTDGILLRTNPIQASADTYSGTLTWTLTSGP